MTDATIDLPDAPPALAEHREALAAGRLTFQRCADGHAWLPPRDRCPTCLSAAWTWEDASGRARVISWVVYHRAYHPAFADRLPYTLAVVELAEGPRLLTNVHGEPLHGDAPVELTIEHEHGLAVARFTLL